MDFPSASEARQKVEQGQYEKAELQSAQVSKAILKAINAGQTCAGIEGTLEHSVVLALRAKGYKVTFGSQYNESNTSISW